MNNLRWLLILPAAVFGLLVAQVAVILVTLFMPDVVSRLTSAFATPLAFVILGSRVAPSYRVHVAGVLTVIMLVAQGMFWSVALLSGWYGGGEKIEASIAVLLGVVGTVQGLFLVYLRERSSYLKFRERNQLTA